MSQVQPRWSFRCRHCGHRVSGAHAGVYSVPTACPGCGHGVAFGSSLEDVLAQPATRPHADALKALPDLNKHPSAGGRLIVMNWGEMKLHKLFIHENWEVLADCTPQRLAELGLTPEQVERSTPPAALPPERPSQHFEATAQDSTVTRDQAR